MRDLRSQAQDVALVILFACAGKPKPRRGQVAGIALALVFAVAVLIVLL